MTSFVTQWKKGWQLFNEAKTVVWKHKILLLIIILPALPLVPIKLCLSGLSDIQKVLIGSSIGIYYTFFSIANIFYAERIIHGNPIQYKTALSLTWKRKTTSIFWFTGIFSLILMFIAFFNINICLFSKVIDLLIYVSASLTFSFLAVFFFPVATFSSTNLIDSLKKGFYLIKQYKVIYLALLIRAISIFLLSLVLVIPIIILSFIINYFHIGNLLISKIILITFFAGYMIAFASVALFVSVITYLFFQVYISKDITK